MQTRTDEEKHFETSLQQADLLRQQSKFQDYTAALQQLLSEQALFYNSTTDINIIKSYHLLAAAYEMSGDLTEAHKAHRHVWKIEMQLGLQEAELSKNDMNRIAKLLKIRERIEALKKFPAYDWCKHATGTGYQKHLIKITELLAKLLHHKEFLTAEQLLFVADQCYMAGCYYNHAKGVSDLASGYLNAAVGIIAPGYPAIWLQLQIAYHKQFNLSKLKHDASKSTAEKLTSGAETAMECQTIMAQCMKECNEIPAELEQPSVFNKIVLFAKYITALIEFQFAKIHPPEHYQAYIKSAFDILQLGLNAGEFADLEDDLTLRVKSLLAYSLTVMVAPPIDPKMIFVELATFLLRDPELKHPEAATIFVFYAKYLRSQYKKDNTKAELLTEMLDNYQKAHLSLIMVGRENSPLEIEVSRYIQHLEHKLHNRISSSNYSPALFTPPTLPRSGSLDDSFTLDGASSSSSPSASRPGT